jgi:hypothetical protein
MYSVDMSKENYPLKSSLVVCFACVNARETSR